MRKKIIFYILLSISGLIVASPLLYALSISFMSAEDLRTGSLLPSSPTFDNYIQAITNVPIAKFLLNSFVTSLFVTIGQLVTSSLAAFAFVFIPFRGKKIIFALVISTMMIPWEATIIPNYMTVRIFGWVNSYAGLSIPFFALAFGIFLLRQYFLTLPKELYEAAQVDGCGRFRFYLTILMPLSRPILATLSIYSFLTTWNMYLWPLLVTDNNDVRTVQIGLKMLQSQEASNSWTMVMAGVILVIVPTLLLLFFGQKQLQRGLTSGALKG